MQDYLDKTLEFFKPRYSEITSYLTALTCLILLFYHPEFWQVYFELLSGAEAGKAALAFIAFGLIATAGFILSILHVFTNRKKSLYEKMCMGVFVMGTNGIAGILAGIEIFPTKWSILFLFPLFNILMGVYLFYQIGLARFEISDENASIFKVMIATITLLIVFAISNYKFHLSWAMTFSICMFYSSTITAIIEWAINYFNLKRSFIR